MAQQAFSIAPAQKPSSLLWVMFLGYFTFGMITNILGGIIPEVIKQYNVSLFQAGLLAFAFFLAYGICSIPTGILVDRFGAKPLILTGAALMGIGCLVISIAASYPVILAMIFAVGVGVTILQAAGNPLVKYLDREVNYHRNLTLTIGFCGIGAFAGPFLLTYVKGLGYGWQTLYIPFAALCLVLLLAMAASTFPKIRTASSEGFRFDQLGKLLAKPFVLLYALGLFFYVGAEVSTASWIVTFFEKIHNVTGEAAKIQVGGILATVMPTLPLVVVGLFWLGQGVGRLVSGAFLNKLGSRTALRLYAFLAVACLLVATLGTQMMSVVGFIACGFFTSVLFTLVFSGAINTIPENPGTLSGILCTAIVGGAVLPPIAGAVGDSFGMQAAMIVPAIGFSYVLLLSIFGRAKYE
jgi:MFS transporter, FHS family, L-fucose permease